MKNKTKHIEHTQWLKPKEVQDVDMAFGGDMEMLLPPYDEIPEDFKSLRNKWTSLQSTWFFKGLPKDIDWDVKEGIDLSKAMRHLKAIQGSWAPKHEHKEAGVGYLMSLWFKDYTLPKAES